MKLIVVSGLSGSGKTVALHMLEDLGYNCIDNLPMSLLERLVHDITSSGDLAYELTAVGIDARAHARGDIRSYHEHIQRVQQAGIACETLFLQTDDQIILKRYSETRRKHPLSSAALSLADAIILERELLSPIAAQADLIIDTSRTTIHQLRDIIRERVHGRDNLLSLQFESFGYKHGLPTDADFIFDVRCLPNPHWIPHLRALTGKDREVIDYLDRHEAVNQMFEDIKQFLDRWLPQFEADSRSYVTVAIGCTGGQHRSVYLAERLAHHFRHHKWRILVRHTELD